MTENMVLYQLYVTRRLEASELQQVAAKSQGVAAEQTKCICSQACGADVEVVSFYAGQCRIVNIRFYPKQRLCTIDALLLDPTEEPGLKFIRQNEVEIEEFLKSRGAFQSIRSILVPLRRGSSLWRYFQSSDHRVLEISIDSVVEEKRTQYQHAAIYHSQLHGNVLYLDDDVMLGESDQEAYTRVLLGLETGKPARNNFADKEILILGGGDGGVICELLKQRPKMVVMCDIDEEVIQMCRRHMRSVCEDAFDTYEAENKRIIFGDCVQYLHECIQAGKKYDFVVNDLTEFPVNKEERGWTYDLATDNSQVMELALKALKPDGRYLCRNGAVAGDYFMKTFEEDCRKIGCQFRVFNSHVPSFYEEYRLCEVWFASSSSSS